MTTKPQLNLTRIVLQDIWHHIWVVILAVVLVVNAAAVVFASHKSRQLTSQWDQLLQQRDKLDIEWRNLLLEEQSLSEHSRITQIATKDLGMSRPLPNEEVVVRVP
ncbi:cell division protein FtsL [Shewanella gelidii]|uniref:Cell division protein FtsL n=1 Tax=Shewanella gelidii TaxID=1642821 RepID=A0A917JV69_9GAMM|nr:cell division protein FtsL [Shewanella gelidii]MCL1098383.1 cell division protein FtsL [Shewanella gelidii]GGI83137.1 cell division protein FtsL [Shewanella gelidii]